MYLIIDTDFWLAGIWVGIFSVTSIIGLVLYLERSKRELYNFLSAVQQGDFTQTKSMTRSVWENDELNRVYRQIQEVFLKLNAEKASNHLFLQAILEHVEIAIIAFSENGQIVIANQAVKKLFGMPHFNSIKKLFRNEPELYKKINVGNSDSFIYKMYRKTEISLLSVNATHFKLSNSEYKLISFQDIRSQLEEKELDSWQKIIRVLTHEIMNSAIPISTLANVIAKMIIDEKGEAKEHLDSDTKNDIYGGLRTIENRSKGLSAFVDSYRSLTKIKPPKFEKTSTSLLINDVFRLLNEKITNQKINIKENIAETLLHVDKELISQVLINLFLNSIEALEQTSNPEISITVSNQNEKTIIKICDNGKGIAEPDIDDVFVPFYTTKKEGSGIGLSLSRQIMRLHKGKISVRSKVGEGTCFTLEF